MRQNVGLFFLTLGSVLLSIGVFRTHLIQLINFYEWKNVPWELRLYCWSRGIRNREDYVKWLGKSQEKNYYPLGEQGELTRSKRIDLDLPIISIVLMVVGFLLCLKYSAF